MKEKFEGEQMKCFYRSVSRFRIQMYMEDEPRKSFKLNSSHKQLSIGVIVEEERLKCKL